MRSSPHANRHGKKGVTPAHALSFLMALSLNPLLIQEHLYQCCFDIASMLAFASFL
jgi:hypothetical protein